MASRSRSATPQTDAILGPDQPGEKSWSGGIACSRATTTTTRRTPKPEPTDGWFRTGDICSLDTDGRITYHGRVKDMLKVGGENVAAAEIEGHLSHHPAVMLAQVVSAPDPKYTEVPAAYIQLAPGTEATEDELIEFCRGAISSFKVPRYVRFVDEWPMSATKIQKVRLRERIANELAAEATDDAAR